MPLLRVRCAAGEREITFEPGRSLSEILAQAGLPVRSGCGGAGACGLCRIRVEAGAAPPPGENECRILGPRRTALGERLACQLFPATDLVLSLDSPLPGRWFPIAPGDLVPLPKCAPFEAGRDAPLGAAVDLGTTHIRATLWDLPQSLRLAGLSGRNPQALFGSDVMNRLTAACADRADAQELAQLATGAIGSALGGLASEAGRRLSEIGRVQVVGNSAMLALMAGRNFHLLLEPASWSAPIDCRPEETASWRDAWGVDPKARIEVAQPLAGFVGSDLLAGVLSAGLAEEPGGLLLDFGTNSEIALFDGETLWATSAAGGPAFEGCGIACGMPAEPGAVYRVEGEPPHLVLKVIGGGDAQGICGSGLVDLIGILRESGTVNAAGRFGRDARGEFRLGVTEGSEGVERLVLNQRDIDAFQRAKAAIGAGTRFLLESSGLREADLKRVCVCGAFGRLLDPAHARCIGLLPDLPGVRVELLGDSALAGCERLLFSRDPDQALDAVRSRARCVNLAQYARFEDLFVDQLHLRPQRGRP